ncbi:MAG: MFS transporter [Methanomassiliicoccales archaeon]|nr:MFS transporter [Methanomassiliicoccales archaeon]
MGKGDEKWYYTFLPYNISGGSTSPLIPLFVTQGLKGTIAEVGIVSALSSVASVPANILWGNLSDTTGKRREYVLIGFIGMALAMILMGLSMTMTEYYLANILLGLLASAAAPVGTVLVLESYDKHEWAKRLGDFSKVGGIGWVIGLVLGTIWLQVLDPDDGALAMRALFVLAGTLSLVSLLLGLKWIPEPKRRVDRESLDKHVLSIPVNRVERARYLPQRMVGVLRISSKNLRMCNFPDNLRKYYIVVFLIFTGFLTFYVGLPIFLSSYVGLSSSIVFIIYLASSLTSALIYGLAGKWVSKKGGKKMQMASIAIRIMVIPTFFVVTLFPMSVITLTVVFCLLHAVMGFCWANIAVAGNALVSNMSFGDFRTQALGMYSAIQGIASIAGCLIGGFVANYSGYLETFLLAIAFIIVGLVILAFTNVEKEPDECVSPHAVHA